MHYYVEIFIYSILTPVLSLQVLNKNIYSVRDQNRYNVPNFGTQSEWANVKRRIIADNRHDTFNDALKKYSLFVPKAAFSFRQSVSDSIVSKSDTTNKDVGDVDYISNRLRNFNPESNRRLEDYVDGPVIVPKGEDLKEFMANLIKGQITPELDEVLPVIKEAMDQVKDEAPGIQVLLKDMKNYSNNFMLQILQKNVLPEMNLPDSILPDLLPKQNDRYRKFNKYSMNKVEIPYLDESPKTYFEATRRHRFLKNHPNLNIRRHNKDAPLIGYDMNINPPRRLTMRRFNEDGIEIPFSERVLKNQKKTYKIKQSEVVNIAEPTARNQSIKIETKTDPLNTTKLLKNRTKRYVHQNIDISNPLPRRMRRFNMDNVEIPYSGETLVDSKINATRRSTYNSIAVKAGSSLPKLPKPLRMRRYNTKGEELSYDKEDGAPKKRQKRMNVFEEEFAYHDKMESAGAGDVETYEKNLKAYERHRGKYRRSSLDEKPKIEDNHVIDKDKAKLLKYAVPISMKITGYLQAPES